MSPSLLPREGRDCLPWVGIPARLSPGRRKLQIQGERPGDSGRAPDTPLTARGAEREPTPSHHGDEVGFSQTDILGILSSGAASWAQVVSWGTLSYSRITPPLISRPPGTVEARRGSSPPCWVTPAMSWPRWAAPSIGPRWVWPSHLWGCQGAGLGSGRGFAGCLWLCSMLLLTCVAFHSLRTRCGAWAGKGR